MRRNFSCQLGLLLFAAMAASAQSPTPADNGTPPAAGQAPSPEITVTGRVQHPETPLPELPPDEFSDCMRDRGALDLSNPSATAALAVCSAKLDWERHLVIDKCVNQDGKSSTAMVIQACTESLEHKILTGRDRIYIFVNRAEAYVAAGDKRRALEDYNDAVKLAPDNPKLYYNRAVFYAMQPDATAALQDLNAALSINAKFVAALQQRAKIYLTQNNFAGALADYSDAVRFQPKTAALWSERGYVYLLHHDYDSAIKDEAEAIRLDPKLARAYFLRGAAFGDIGNSPNAVSDLVTAVGLDPTLDRYVSTKGKSASITLPPL
jgi:tetratricopeptide (TPR) repeat protein